MKKKSVKATYGKFYTTNYEYILKEFHDFRNNIKDDRIIEPFAGKGHLISWLYNENIEAYDVHSYGNIIQRDTLKNPPRYHNKWVVTNPPYLARNKSMDKTIFDYYKTNDLYKAFLLSIIQNPPKGGLIIIRKSDIKLCKLFFSKFFIKKLIIFDEKVFNDTTNTVCSFIFYFIPNVDKHIIKTTIYPSLISLQIKINSLNNWLYGGELYTIYKKNNLVKRLVNEDIPKSWYWSKMVLYSIDTGGDKRIRLEYKPSIYVGKSKNRNMAGIILNLKINDPKKIVNEFNHLIESYRKKYFSLFLPNYRESKNYIRKRIPFRLAYGIIQYLIQNQDNIE